MDLTELLDRGIAHTGKQVRMRVLLWILGVPLGLFVFMVLFIKSDSFVALFGGSVGLVILAFLVALYFLPSIKAYQDKKTNRQAILALNIFLGWTLVGWVVALSWAYTKDIQPTTAVAVSSVFCPSCGKYSPGGSPFCGQCGKKLAQA